MSAQTCEVVFDIYTAMCYIIITARGSLTDAWSLLGRVTVKSKRRRHVFCWTHLLSACALLHRRLSPEICV